MRQAIHVGAQLPPPPQIPLAFSHGPSYPQVNSTFYGCPDPHAVANSVTRWAARCAPGFEMGLKAPRTITHEGRLAEPAALAALRRFLEVAASLGDALGPLLLQVTLPTRRAAPPHPLVSTVIATVSTSPQLEERYRVMYP